MQKFQSYIFAGVVDILLTETLPGTSHVQVRSQVLMEKD